MKKTFQKGSTGSGNYVRVHLDTDRLQSIETALHEMFMTRVGILGNKINRTFKEVKTESGKKRYSALAQKYSNEPTLTNAEIGLLMERGSVSQHIPARSFLELPLVVMSSRLLEDKREIWAVFKGGPETRARLKAAYTKLGHVAENLIQEAFETAGFGMWDPDRPRTIARKHSSAPLINTAQLRRSITSDVVSR